MTTVSAAAPARSSAGSIDRATEAHRRGVAANARGRPAEALRALDRAWAELDPATGPEAVRLRVRIALTRSLALFERDGRAAAEAELDRAERVLDGHADPELEALTWSQRANVRARSGDLAGAAALLDDAGDRLTALSPLDRTVILINRGLLACELGRLGPAVTDLRAAVAEADAAGLGPQRFMALHNLGWVDHLRGDLPAALAAFDRAARDTAGVSTAVARLDRGRVMLEAGLIDDALAVLEPAEAACRRAGLGHAALEARYETARAAWLAGRPSAGRLVAAGRRAADRRGADGWTVRLELLTARIAPDSRTGRRVRQELAGLDPAGDPGGPAGPADPAVRVDRAVLAAELALRAGAPDRAGRWLAEATTGSARQPPPLTVRLELHRVRALHRLATGDEPAARRELRRAATALDRADASTPSIDLRTARQLHGQALAALDVRLARAHGAVATLRAVERWRARSVRLPRVRPEPDPVLADRLTEVRRLSERWRAGAAELDELDRMRRLSELADTSRRAADAARAARGGTSPSAVAVAAVTRSAVVDPSALREALAGQDATLISFAAVEDRLLAVVVDRRRHRAVDLGPLDATAEPARRLRADLQMAARPLPPALRAGVGRSAVDLGTVLAERLLAPLGRVPGRLVVVPCRQLSGLPWGLIARDRPVTVALSATAWVAGLARAAWPTPPRYAVVRGPRLAAAESERTVVRRAWGAAGEVVVDDTAAGVTRALGACDLVHVAAHGRHHQQNPMFSAIELDDGPVCLYDLEPAAVTARAVVLAACDTGRARVRPGDEPLGLCTGLLALGVASVIAPVAPVDDARTVELMGDLHRRLAAGTPGDVALAEAVGVVEPGALDAPGGRVFVQTGTAW